MRHPRLFVIGVVGVLALLGSPQAQAAGRPGPPPADPQIVYVVSGSPSSKLYVSDVDGSNAGLVYTAEAEAIFNYPSWSPDGKSLAFRRRAGSKDILAVDVVINSKGVPTGANLRSLVVQQDGGGNCGSLNWSPTGDWIATTTTDSIVTFSSECEAPAPCSVTTLYTVPDGYYPNDPVWSPDEERVAFNLSCLYPCSGDAAGIYILDLTSEPITAQRLTAYTGGFKMDWARAGDRLAIDDGSSVYVLDFSDPSDLILTSYGPGKTPSWSPCDDALVFSGSQGKVQIIDLATGGVRDVTKKAAITPDWRRGTCP